jgi:DNA-binding transcriptional LysR family regulator
MAADLGDLTAFAAVARAGGFRDAARATGGSASSLSEAVRRLEAKLGVRLLDGARRSVAPIEVGARLLDRLGPALEPADRYAATRIFSPSAFATPKNVLSRGSPSLDSAL